MGKEYDISGDRCAVWLLQLMLSSLSRGACFHHVADRLPFCVNLTESSTKRKSAAKKKHI